jgi:hypothetical protein
VETHEYNILNEKTLLGISRYPDFVKPEVHLRIFCKTLKKSKNAENNLLVFGEVKTKKLKLCFISFFWVTITLTKKSGI